MTQGLKEVCHASTAFRLLLVGSSACAAVAARVLRLCAYPSACGGLMGFLKEGKPGLLNI
jgi:hypothetical protein